MKLLIKWGIVFSILFSIAIPANSVIIPATVSSSNTILPGDFYRKIVALRNISTMKVKDFQKVIGRKLTLKEKIAVKILQWKLKKGIKITKEETPGKKGNTAMILGIIAIASLLLPYVSIAAIPCAILAIIFGNQAKKADPKDGRAKAGVILGWVTLGLIVLALILVIAILASGGFWF